MTYGIHRPSDFLAPPSELPVAGAPSPVAFRRLLKSRLFRSRKGDLDTAWQLDWEADQLVAGRLLHLVWALGVEVEAAREAGLVVQARGWLAGTATAAALGLVDIDPAALGLSGADGLAGPEGGSAHRLELAAPPASIGDVAAWFLEWGRRRRRRFTVALVAPGPRLLPFDWEDVRELAHPAGAAPRTLTLAWVPEERVVQIPWGETEDGYPVALLPPVHLMSSGVHVVSLTPDPLLGAAVSRRPADAAAPLVSDALRVANGLSDTAPVTALADDAGVWNLFSGGWIPPAVAEESPLLSALCREDQPRTFEAFVNLVALSDDDLKRDYFLERYQTRKERGGEPGPELPASAAGVLAPTRGLLMYVEQIAQLIGLYAGWEPPRAYRLAASATRPEGAQLMLEAAWERSAERGYPPDDLKAVSLAVRRWAPLVLSKRRAACRAALLYELGLLRVTERRQSHTASAATSAAAARSAKRKSSTPGSGPPPP